MTLNVPTLNLNVPTWITGFYFWATLVVLGCFVLGLLLWLLWKSVVMILKSRNLMWAYRAYISLKFNGEKLDSRMFDKFMPVIVHDWAQKNADRYLSLHRTLQRVKSTLSEEDQEFVKVADE